MECSENGELVLMEIVQRNGMMSSLWKKEEILWCSPEIGGRVEGVSSYFCLFLNTYAASTLS